MYGALILLEGAILFLALCWWRQKTKQDFAEFMNKGAGGVIFLAMWVGSAYLTGKLFLSNTP